MTQSKTFLFFPAETGLAHICRSLSIAEELQSRGHKIIFALPKRKHHFFKYSTIALTDIGEYYSNDSDINSGFMKVVAYDILSNNVSQEIKLINYHNPDAVIVDNKYSALVSGRISGRKVFAVFNGQTLPYGCVFPNLVNSTIINRFLTPLLPTIWSAILHLYTWSTIKIFSDYKTSNSRSDWFRSVEYIIPEPIGYFTAKSKDLRLNYVGPLFWNKFKSKYPSWIDDIRPNGKTVYFSFGGSGFAVEQMISLSRILLDSGYRVVITTGTLCNPEIFPTHVNLFVSRFIAGNIISKKVDLVICHGGQGTATDALKSGVPVICVPTNPDQIFHSLRMQELGVGKMVYQLTVLDLINIFSVNLKKLSNNAKRISPENLLNSIDEELNNIRSYRENI